MSLVFIICILVTLVWAADSYIYLRRVQKHDRVLFSFSRLRSAVSKELRSHYDIVFLRRETEESPRGTLSPDEIAAARFLSRTLDDISRHYDRHKTTMFNLRKMRRMIEQDLARYREAERAARTHLHSVPPGKVADLYAEFSRALARAFVAYTPFIRAEFILRLLWSDLAEQISQIRRTAGGEQFA